VKPPKRLPLFALMTVKVLEIPSQCEWKSVDLKPSLDARYFRSHNFNKRLCRHGPVIVDSKVYKKILFRKYEN
jgi:hypothetical protein